MQFALVDRGRIERLWPVIAELLWPAVRQDPTYRLQGLYERLTAEQPTALLFEAGEGASGLLVLSVGEDQGELVAWVTAIAGSIEGRPKQRIAAMRAALAEIETVARSAGCKALRMCGRDYSRLFPGYRPFEGARNGLEKRLA